MFWNLIYTPKKENKTSPGKIQNDKHILNLELMNQHV